MGNAMKRFLTCWYPCSVLCGLLLLALLPAPPAFADGGAPQLAYVAGAAQGISIIDIAQLRVIGTIALAGNPHSILLSPDGAMLYATQPALGRVAVIAAKTGKTLCTASLPGQPSFLALKLDGTVLYVAGQGDTNARALNPKTCAVQQTFETHEPIYGLAVAASTAPDATPLTPNQLWITGATALTVYEVNGSLLGSVPFADGPQGICIPAGFTAYVTTRQGTVVALDLNTRKVIKTLLSGGVFGSMDYDATTGEIYVPDESRNQLDVLIPVIAGAAAPIQEPVRILHLDASPQSVAITNDGSLGFVALSNGQAVMLDIPGRKTVTSFAVGGTPQIVITGSYPPENSPTASIQQKTNPSSSALFGNSWRIFSAGLAAAVLLGALWFLWRAYQKRHAGHPASTNRL
jgi:DNA-binding beta-propeller fold protein YncE